MKKLSLIYFVLFGTTLLNAQNMSNTTVNSCATTIYDDGGASSSYSSTSYQMTICSDDGSNVEFNISYLDIRSADDLIIYEGTGTSGTILYNNDNFSPVGSAGVTLGGSSTCITIFWDPFSSGGSFYDGFEIDISCVGGGGGSATCSDGVQNGDETGIDCGGATCPPCAVSGSGNIDGGDVVSCAYTLYDDGGSSGTYSDQDYTWTICSDDGSNMLFTVNSLLVSSSFHELTIYQGSNTSGTVLFSSDNFSPVGSTGVLIDGNATCVTVVFNSSLSAGGDGFEIDFICESQYVASCNDGIQNGDETGVDCGGSNCPDCDVLISDGDLTLCDFVVYDDGGSTGDHSSNSYTQTICSNNGGGAIQLTVDMMDLGAFSDLIIYEGVGTGGSIIFNNDGFNGVGSVGTPITTTNTCVTISFVPSGTPTSGFEIAIDCLTPSCNDGIMNQDEEGVDCGGVCPVCILPILDVCGPNVVDNGDFESTDLACNAAVNGPYGTSNQMSRPWLNHTPVAGWYGTVYRNDTTISFPSPDYHNDGCVNASSIACFGSASLGFWTHFGGNESGEYIQTQLNSALTAGAEYCITVDAVARRGSLSTFPSSDKLGFYFHNNTYANGTGFFDCVADNGNVSFVGPGSTLNLTPQVSNVGGDMITTSCSGLIFSFCAAGGEDHLVIGNFEPGASASGGAEYISIDNLVIQEACPLVFDVDIAVSDNCFTAGDLIDLTMSETNLTGGCFTGMPTAYAWYLDGSATPFSTDASVSVNAFPGQTYTAELTYNAGCQVATFSSSLQFDPASDPSCVVLDIDHLNAELLCNDQFEQIVAFELNPQVKKYRILLDGLVVDEIDNTYNTELAQYNYTIHQGFNMLVIEVLKYNGVWELAKVFKSKDCLFNANIEIVEINENQIELRYFGGGDLKYQFHGFDGKLIAEGNAQKIANGRYVLSMERKSLGILTVYNSLKTAHFKLAE